MSHHCMTTPPLHHHKNIKRKALLICGSVWKGDREKDVKCEKLQKHATMIFDL